MIVYLVRHGLSIANVSGLVTGTPMDKLVDKGLTQASCLGKWMSDARIEPKAFYVSQWRRAKQTAEIIFPQVNWNEDERLGETDAGNVAERPLHNFLVENPDFYLSNTNLYPGGESHLDLNNRVLNFWKELEVSGLSSVILVTHSGPISCILQHVLGLGMEEFPAFLPAQATVTILERKARSGNERVQFRINGFALGPVENIHVG